MSVVQTFLREGNSWEDFQKLYGIKTCVHKKYSNLIGFKYLQHSANFNEPIVQQSRGLILDRSKNWEIIAKPFEKFWNWGEPTFKKNQKNKKNSSKCQKQRKKKFVNNNTNHSIENNPETLDLTIPMQFSNNHCNTNERRLHLYEKLDGTLTFLYFYNDEWNVGTCGSPDAGGQVKSAMLLSGVSTQQTFEELFWETFKKLNQPKFPKSKILKEFTFLFELVGSKNQVIVRYPEDQLYLLGCKHLYSDLELTPSQTSLLLNFSLKNESVEEERSEMKCSGCIICDLPLFSGQLDVIECSRSSNSSSFFFEVYRSHQKVHLNFNHKQREVSKPLKTDDKTNEVRNENEKESLCISLPLPKQYYFENIQQLKGFFQNINPNRFEGFILLDVLNFKRYKIKHPLYVQLHYSLSHPSLISSQSKNVFSFQREEEEIVNKESDLQGNKEEEEEEEEKERGVNIEGMIDIIKSGDWSEYLLYLRQQPKSIQLVHQFRTIVQKYLRFVNFLQQNIDHILLCENQQQAKEQENSEQTKDILSLSKTVLFEMKKGNYQKLEDFLFVQSSKRIQFWMSLNNESTSFPPPPPIHSSNDHLTFSQTNLRIGKFSDNQSNREQRNPNNDESNNSFQSFLPLPSSLRDFPTPSLRFVHGSADSIDLDVIYVVPYLPSSSLCHLFCSAVLPHQVYRSSTSTLELSENRNIVVISDGIVTQCFKGSVDELNNQIYRTFHFHQSNQDSLCPITRRVKRDIECKLSTSVMSILGLSVHKNSLILDISETQLPNHQERELERKKMREIERKRKNNSRNEQKEEKIDRDNKSNKDVERRKMMELREEVKSILKTKDIVKMVNMISKLDWGLILKGIDVNQMKKIAFQMAQICCLIEGKLAFLSLKEKKDGVVNKDYEYFKINKEEEEKIKEKEISFFEQFELYTKQEVIKYYPQLSPFIQREKNSWTPLILNEFSKKLKFLIVTFMKLK